MSIGGSEERRRGGWEGPSLSADWFLNPRAGARIALQIRDRPPTSGHALADICQGAIDPEAVPIPGFILPSNHLTPRRQSEPLQVGHPRLDPAPVLNQIRTDDLNLDEPRARPR